MSIGPVTMLAIYIVCWWVTLFVILPLGSHSHAEAGMDLKDGGDPGAPVVHNLKRKFITTTWVSVIVWLAVMGIIASGVVTLPELPELKAAQGQS